MRLQFSRMKSSLEHVHRRSISETKWNACVNILLHQFQDLDSTVARSEVRNRNLIKMYLSLYFQIEEWIQKSVKEETRGSHCAVIGISCPQGGGKTTMVGVLKVLLEQQGLRCATLSLDDVYWTHEDQLAICQRTENPLLKYRGNPGTHDITLLCHTIEQIKTSKNSSMKVKLPRYDKSAYHGRGDRFPETQWPVQAGPFDVLLIEGWCIGFTSQKEDEIQTPELVEINRALKDFDAIYKELTAIVVMEIEDLRWIYKWREEAEGKKRRAGLTALTREQTVDFIDRFIPTYKQYLPRLYAHSTHPILMSIPRYQFQLDSNRQLVTKETQEIQ